MTFGSQSKIAALSCDFIKFFQTPVSDLYRIRPTGNFDDGHRIAAIYPPVGKMFGKAFCINGCRSNDQFEFRSAGQQSLHHSEQKVDVERPFVCLVNDERVVLSKIFVRLRLGKQDAIGHQFDKGIVGDFSIESNFVTDGMSERRIKFFGNSSGNGSGGNSSRLGVPDGAVDSTPDFETDFRQLRGLPGTGFSTHDDDLIVSDQIGNLAPPLDDGQVIVVGEVECFEQGASSVRIVVFHGKHCSRNRT